MNEYLIAHVGHTQRLDEHIYWWRPESLGYTICVDKAGRYSEQQARSICAETVCIAVPVEAAKGLARTTPYFRLPNGTLGKLYDGGPHSPVENRPKEWAAIKEHALLIGKYAKPTPMAASKQRAIYVDALMAAQAEPAPKEAP